MKKLSEKEYKYANIEAERVRHGLSQEKLSDLLGINRRTYIYWQNKSGDIPASKLLIMATLFNCSIDYLLQVQ